MVRSKYNSFNNFVNGTLSARVNGYVAGKGTMKDFEKFKAKVGFPQALIVKLEGMIYK